ncbi:MAG: helix-turn-helix domain-containing protein [Bradyrhizobium sp.]|nr:helix-turn-helix domain-containing protein [Bradyrhizobium sp.]
MKVNTKKIIAAQAIANRRGEAGTAPAADGSTDGHVAAATPGPRYRRHYRDNVELAGAPTATMVQPAEAPNHRRSPAPKTDPDLEPLLTPKEMAKFLRVSQSWLAKARMRGDGPPYMLFGRSIRYSEGGTMRWMKSCARQSTSER